MTNNFVLQTLHKVRRPTLKQFIIKCNGCQATILSLFEKFDTNRVPLEQIKQILGEDDEKPVDIAVLDTLVNSGLLLKSGDELIVNDEFDDTVKTIDLTKAKTKADSKVARTHETVQTIKKNRLLYLKPAVIRVLKRRYTESQQNTQIQSKGS